MASGVHERMIGASTRITVPLASPPTMRTRRRSPLLALLLVACSTISTAPSPSGSGVRVPPPIPSGDLYATSPAGAAPGSLLASQEIGAPDGMRAWAIAYASTGVHDEPITVTGLVLAPAAGTTASRPVVALGHWSVGIADPCAPSRRGIGPGSTVAVVGIPFVRAGGVVVATDYPGLGTAGTAAFLDRLARGHGHARCGARGAIDRRGGRRGPAWRSSATRRAGRPRSGRASRPPCARRSSRSWPSLRCRRSATWSRSRGPASARAAAAARGSTPPSSWRAGRTCSDSTRDRSCTDAGARLATDLRARCPGDVRVTASPLASDPLDDPAWLSRLTAESAGAAAIDAPVWISHGTADQLVPIVSSRAVRDRLCALGGDVTPQRAAGGGPHGAILDAGRVDAVVTWVQARFAGTAAPNGCG